MRVPDEMRRKLDPKSLACVLLGYFPGRIYRLWDPVGRKVHQSRDVIFDEGSCHRTRVAGEQGISTATPPSVPPVISTATPPSPPSVPPVNSNAAPNNRDTSTDSNDAPDRDTYPTSFFSQEISNEDPLSASSTDTPAPRRSTRARNPSRRQRETNEYLLREETAG